MKNRLILLAAYFLDRAGELSTWRGIITLLTAFGILHAPDRADEFAAYGVTLYGIISAVFPDDIDKIKAYAAKVRGA